MIEEMHSRDVYELLTTLARKEIKKPNKLLRKYSSFRAESFRLHQCCSDLEDRQILHEFEKGQVSGDRMRCISNQYTHMTLAL